MTILGINILLAAAPTLLLLFWFWKIDSRKPEPGSLILKLFFWGCVSVIPAAVAELLMGRFKPFIPRNLYLLFDAFVVAAFCEETIKYLTVRLVAWKHRAFDEITDGIVYTVAAGMGFAFLENILYSFGSNHFAGILILRGITAVPLHALCSGLIGYSIGRSRFIPGASVLPGLALAILIHGLYDYFLFTGQWRFVWLIIPLMIGGYILLGHLIKKAKNLDAKRGYS